MKIALQIATVVGLFEISTSFNFANLNFLENEVSKNLADQFTKLKQPLKNQVGALLLSGHIQTALACLLMGGSSLGTSSTENLDLLGLLRNNNLLGNVPLGSIVDDLPLASVLGGTPIGGLVENSPVGSVLGGTLGRSNGLSGGLDGDLPLVGSSPVGGLLENNPLGGIVENSPVKAVGGALGGENNLLGGSGLVGGLLGKRGKNGKRHLVAENGPNKRNLPRTRSRRQVLSGGVDLVTPGVGEFLVNIAENVRNSNSWNHIQARFWMLGSDTPPVDVMLEFEADVAVVDDLVHGETYIVEINVVEGGRIIHSFPPVQVYIS